MSCPDIPLKYDLKYELLHKTHEVHGLSFSVHLCTQPNSKPNMTLTLWLNNSFKTIAIKYFSGKILEIPLISNTHYKHNDHQSLSEIK